MGKSDAYAAVGDDCGQEIVLGVGWTAVEAIRDAKRTGAGKGAELRAEPISLRQAERIAEGKIDWAALRT